MLARIIYCNCLYIIYDKDVFHERKIRQDQSVIVEFKYIIININIHNIYKIYIIINVNIIHNYT